MKNDSTPNYNDPNYKSDFDKFCDSTPKEEVSLCGICQCMTHTVGRNCGKCGCLKPDSTPKEGWEEKIFYILKSFEQAIRFCLSMKRTAQSEEEILTHKKHANDSLSHLLSQEIAKARQETRQEIKEWVESYNKRSDGINKSDLIKKLEEDK